MKKNVQKTMVLLLLLIAGSATVRGQQGFGTNAPAASAVVDMTATNKGVLLPRIALTATTVAAPVSAPATNLVVFNTATAGDVTPGLYFWNGTSWIRLLVKGEATGTSWNLTGNTGTTPGTNYVGTPDAQDLAFGTNGAGRVRVTSTGSIGIGTTVPAANALLDVSSTTKGFLPPRMTSDQMAAIANPVEGLMVYNTTQQCLAYYSKGAFNCAFAAPAPPPVASNVTATGANVLTGSTLTATYTYSQSTGIAAGTPAYQWYYATDASGTGKAVVPGASGSTYTIAAPVTPMVNHIAVAVTPLTTTGTAGAQVLSPWRAVITNAAPSFGSVTNTATALSVSFGATVTAASYTDTEGDAAGTPLYQWYRYDDAAGNGKAAIGGATGATYTFASGDIGKYIKAGVTAIATTGATTGTEQLASSYLGPIVAWTCGTSFVATHTAGAVAPVTKTVTYNTVSTAIGGTGTKCWITQNLGATNQATGWGDYSEAAAGWYWQYNRIQGFKHDGTTMTPSSMYTGAAVGGNWDSASDPCMLLLGNGWRLPTTAEMTAIKTSAFSTTCTSDQTRIYGNTVLKLHTSGSVKPTTNALYYRASTGGRCYQSTTSDGYDSNNMTQVVFDWSSGSGNSCFSVYTTLGITTYGLTLRCLR